MVTRRNHFIRGRFGRLLGAPHFRCNCLPSSFHHRAWSVRASFRHCAQNRAQKAALVRWSKTHSLCQSLGCRLSAFEVSSRAFSSGHNDVCVARQQSLFSRPFYSSCYHLHDTYSGKYSDKCSDLNVHWVTTDHMIMSFLLEYVTTKENHRAA
jgi:hypothetical protein